MRLAIGALLHRKVQVRCGRLGEMDLAAACGCSIREVEGVFERNALRLRPGLLPLIEILAIAVRVVENNQSLTEASAGVGFPSTEALDEECHRWLGTGSDALRERTGLACAMDRLHQTLRPEGAPPGLADLPATPSAAKVAAQDRPTWPRHIEEALYEKGEQWRTLALRSAIGLGLSMDDAEDLAQEVLLRLVRHLEKKGPGASVSPGFVRTAAVNLWIDEYMRKQGENATAVGSSYPGPIVHEARREDLHRGISALPEPQRTVVRLRYLAGWRNAPVAKLLGRSEGAIDKLRRRGIHRLKRDLGVTAG